MVRASRVAPCLFLLALIPTLMSMALNARDVSYVDQLFYKIEKFPLASHDRIALRALRNRFEEETIKPTGTASMSCSCVQQVSSMRTSSWPPPGSTRVSTSNSVTS